MPKHKPPNFRPNGIARYTEEGQKEEKGDVKTQKNAGNLNKSRELIRKLVDEYPDNTRSHRRQEPSFIS